MSTFKVRVGDLTGFASTDDTALADWLNEGVRELVNVFPDSLKQMCYSKNTFTSAAVGSESETLASQHIGNVFAGSVECRPILSTDKYKANDSTSLLYATSTDPVYYVEGSKINILPASISNCVYYLIGASSVAVGDSAIASFPDEAEHLVVLYASMKSLQQMMNSKKDSLPSDVIAPVLPEWPTFTSLVLPAAPVMEKMEGLRSMDISTLTAPIFNKEAVAPDFGDADNWINVEEDNEMLNARMSVINGQISEFNAKVSNELNNYNKENAIWQKQIEELIQNNTHKTEFNAEKLETYKTDISKYQQEVSTEIQKWTNEEFNIKVQEYSIKYQNAISKYAQDIANHSAKLQKETTDYQWYEKQYIQLKQDYNQGIQILIGGEGASPQQEQGE
tara:strand:+ start:614 stop:1789 length:1176 start_codon:yes stop_codon:yes gene_type:complete